MPEIHNIKLGITNCYLIKENDKLMLIDAGIDGKEKRFEKRLHALGYNLNDIDILIITHVHFDHAGIAAWLKERSRLKIIVHKNEAHILSRGLTPIPAGTNFFGKILNILGNIFNFLFRVKATEADIVADKLMPLKELGFSASIIPTPGHTEGSVSVLFDSGECFVGDCCISMFNKKDVFPPFANNATELLKSWKILLDSEAKSFYPGHGKVISPMVLEQSYRKNKNRF